MLSVVSILPPPRTGQTLVTRAMCERLGDRRDLDVVAVRNRSGVRGARWTLRKHALLLGGLIRAGIRGAGRGDLYFVPDAAGGLWFNVVEAGVMRMLFREVWLHHHVFSYAARRDWRMALILRLLGRRAQHIVLGPAMAEGLRRQYGATRLTLLDNSPFVAAPPPPRPRPALRQVGFLGNITRDKGITLFMQAVSAVQAEAETGTEGGGQVRCVIAGPIREAALRAEVEAFCAAAPATRRWIGPVQGAAKAEFLAATDLLLFPSRYANEAQPMVIYEALAAGTPVLATARGCIPDQLAGTGWVFAEAAFVAEAGQAMRGWLRDPAAFTAASQAAAARFRDQRALAAEALERVLARITGPDRDTD